MYVCVTEQEPGRLDRPKAGDLDTVCRRDGAVCSAPPLVRPSIRAAASADGRVKRPTRRAKETKAPLTGGAPPDRFARPTCAITPDGQWRPGSKAAGAK
uniref:Uncharacterized protein n=1 Tax=Plectus sambesii TaxID=2011161 RepID=A0A914XQV7_9BILA